MPARAGYDDAVDRLFEPLRRACLSPRVAAAVESTPGAEAAPKTPTIQPGLSAAELEARLRAAQSRIAVLETRLSAAERAWAGAERRATDLEARNHELAADLDNALDQLSGHALHAEQERLVHPPAWGAWTNSTGREDYSR